jgi:hypothetical protein
MGPHSYLLPTILLYCTYLPTYETLPRAYLLQGGSRMFHIFLWLDFLPELDPNVMMWLNLIAVIVTLAALISAYRKEDILQNRYKILSRNYETFLAEKILEEMEKEDPEKAKEIRAKLKERLAMPEGKPKILIDPERVNPEDLPLGAVFLLDRLQKTKETGGHNS